MLHTGASNDENAFLVNAELFGLLGLGRLDRIMTPIYHVKHTSVNIRFKSLFIIQSSVTFRVLRHKLPKYFK